MTQGAEKLAKAEAEVERLRSIVSHMENEKNEQERHIRELQEQVKESNKKMASLKRTHQAEKKKTAQMLEEVRVEWEPYLPGSLQYFLFHLVSALDSAPYI